MPGRDPGDVRQLLTGLAIVLGAALVAWIVVVARMRGMMVAPRVVPGGLGFFLGLWVTMTAAMMLPAAAPTVLVVTRLAAPGRSAPILFVAGYLVLWGGYGLLGYGLVRLLPAFSERQLVAGGAIVAAGLYQLTPLKRACLRRCRAPLGFVVHRWRGGALGPLVLGLDHGLVCVGCCAGLMVILFALGLMSLIWMAIVTAAVCAEKLLPRGERLSVGFALALVALGLSVLA